MIIIGVNRQCIKHTPDNDIPAISRYFLIILFVDESISYSGNFLQKN